MKYPVTHSPRVAACYVALAQIDQNWAVLCDDPMSLYAPTADFRRDYEKVEISVLKSLLAAGREDKDEAAVRFALAAYESYLP